MDRSALEFWSVCRPFLRDFMVLHVPSRYCAGGKIEKNEMGGTCGTYGRRERGAQGSGGET